MANDTTPYIGNDGNYWLNIDTNKTLAVTDCGVIQNIIADSVVITLPATVVGYNYTVRNGGVPANSAIKGTGSNGTVLVAVSPNASDNIAGFATAAVDNKDVLNTKATSKVGDFVQIVGDGTTAVGWTVVSSRGTWAREA